MTTWTGGMLDDGGVAWNKYLETPNATYGAHAGGGDLLEPREGGLPANQGSGAGVPPVQGASCPRSQRGRDARRDSRDGCPTTASRDEVLAPAFRH